MNIILLAAGKDEKSHDDYPKFLTEIFSKTLLEHQLDFLLKLKNPNINLIVNQYDCHKFHLKEIVKKINESINVFEIRDQTKGALFSSLMCVDNLNFKDELLVMNCNEYVDLNLNDFIESCRDNKSDAQIVSFKSIHPRYSYLKEDKNGMIEEIYFNKPPSKDACTGLVWMKDTKNFFLNSEKLVLKKSNYPGAIYFNDILNEFILSGSIVKPYKIKSDHYFPLKSDEHLSNLQLNFREKL